MTNKELQDRWNTRYANEEFAYGELPNKFLKEQLDTMPAGTILFPADGEGRNSVYAATRGWTVSSFDISTEGRNKALKLAKAHEVTIDYQCGEFNELTFPTELFDVIALIYAHFQGNKRPIYHKALLRSLKPGGLIILEAFSKKHLEYRMRNERIGGPMDAAMLFSIEELQSDFSGLEFIELYETEVELDEGFSHVGTGAVVRCVARKHPLGQLQ